MTNGELKAAVDGLYAYDSGSVDSGIHDEALRERVQKYVASLAPPERRFVLSRVMLELCLSEQSLADGYGWEDAAALGRWYEDQFGVG